MAGQPDRKIEPSVSDVSARDSETQTAVGPEITGTPTRSITARAIALGIPLVALNAYWVTLVEVRWYTLDGTSLPLFITPIFSMPACCRAIATVLQL